MNILKRIIPFGTCDLCHKNTERLDLYVDERKIVCQSCSQEIQQNKHIWTTYIQRGVQKREKTVTAGSKSSGRIYLPQTWIGGRVVVILIDPPEQMEREEL